MTAETLNGEIQSLKLLYNVQSIKIPKTVWATSSFQKPFDMLFQKVFKMLFIIIFR